MIKNAIERRIDLLASLWNEASDNPAIRLVRWVVDTDERRMLDVFVALENKEVGQTADGFLRLTASFEGAGDYAPSLVRELVKIGKASEEGLRSKELRDDWTLPPIAPNEGSGRYFLRAVDSLKSHYPDRMDCLVLFLAPAAISDAAAWRRWLEQMIGAGIPASLRVMVADPIDTPLLGELERKFPDLVLTIEPRLDMPAAMDELARSEGSEGPARAFRIHLVALAAAAQVKNGAGAQKAADQALAVARAEAWHDQEAVVQMAMAATRLATSEFDLAIKAYRSAFKAAEVAAEAAHPAAPKLRVAAGMGLAGAMLAASRWPDAARVYEATAPLANAAQDGVMVIEAWRMASYCHAQSGAAAAAWRCGNEALGAGETLDEPMRQASTLPWVGQTMLQLLDSHERKDEYAAVVQGRLSRLLGEGWEECLQTADTLP
ncbi:hypothetical protein [Reyranella soli]|uniref:MalT-like TPR region domain-containing protein n=1 Tax=Reyranella soli TaxID=1230389 RepID=A0A512NDL3_9HYPH|nr:hypothetical protein [Reyranella soli]GEP57023.1 hypothetical protein RSO01_41890 [Reyranella soli]